MSRKQIFGLIGSAVLFIGVFAPIVSVPVVGTVNYFNNGRGDGVVVMLLALLSFVLVVSGKYQWLWLTGCVTAGTLVASFLSFQSVLSEAQGKVQSDLANNPFKGVAEMALQSVQIQWGWPLLIIGSVMLIASAALKEPVATTNLEGAIAPTHSDILVLVSIVLGLLIPGATALWPRLRPVLQSAGQSAGPRTTETTRIAAPIPKGIYELTTDDVTRHPGWTSHNISVMGLKIGDRTTNIDKSLGAVENSRTLAEDYLTIHQGNGVFVYTFKITGKARTIEVNQAFAKKVADAKLQKLLSSGDLKTMREVLGMEEGNAVDNTEDNSTEYPYDSRGFRFVKFKVGGKTLNAIRFVELRSATTQ